MNLMDGLHKHNLVKTKEMKRKSVDARQNPHFEEKKKYKSHGSNSNPLLLSRVKQYLESNKHKPVISVGIMAEDIQRQYGRDYGRLKKNYFKIAVEKAYESVLSNPKGLAVNERTVEAYSKLEAKHLEKKQKFTPKEESSDSEQDSDSDSFSSDNPEYVEHKDRNSMNSFLSSMYKKTSQTPGKDTKRVSLSAPATPQSQPLDSDSEQHFVIDRQGNMNQKKANHLINLHSCPNSPARDSSDNKSTPKSKKDPQQRVANKPTLMEIDLTEEVDLTADKQSEDSIEEHKVGINSNVKVQNIKTSEKAKTLKTATEEETRAKQLDKKMSKVKDRRTMKKKQRTGDKSSEEKKEPTTQVSSVKFSDIGGNDSTLKEVCKLLIHMKHPEVYETLGVTPPRGFLLHGPPGCGKTLLAHAIAGELELPFIKVAATEMVSGVSGESEEKVRDIFQQAMGCAPCVLFLDEIDSITPKRENASKDMERRIVSQLLTCMDDLNDKTAGHVLVIGATNRPDSLDPALRRAGRFDREICLGIPDEQARIRILKVLCKGLRLAPDFDYLSLARNTPGYVGADLMALSREAAIVAVNRAFHDLQVLGIEKVPEDGIINQTEKPANVQEISSGIKSSSLNEGSTDNDVINCSEKDDIQALSEDVSAEIVDGNQSAPDNLEHSSVIESSSNNCGTDDNGSNIDANIQPNDIESQSSVRNIDSSNNVSSLDFSIPANFTAVPISKVQNELDAEFKLVLSLLKDCPPLTAEQLESLCITMEDFQEALKHVQPSAQREGFATVPNVTWDDIGALKDIREELQMAILAPVRHPEQFDALGLTNPPGVLLAGPPGCGKTLLAKAIANESGINFISVKGPELLNMYVGESERAVRQVFQRARNSSPCVIFFDELDALCPRRSGTGEGGASVRVVNQLLTEMDGLESRKQVFIMGATNRPDIIDPAIMRPGRLDKILYVGLPTAEDRLDILKTLTRNGSKPVLSDDVDLREVATHPKCQGFTGADLAALVREASVTALKVYMIKPQAVAENVAVNLSHFHIAMQKLKPSVTAKDHLIYERMRDRLDTS